MPGRPQLSNESWRSVFLALLAMWFAQAGLNEHTARAADDIQARVEEEQIADKENATLTALERLSNAFSEIVEAVKPSVVHIQTMRKQDSLVQELQEFFGDKSLRSRPVAGTGSGVIIAEDGYLVTNCHVVADCEVVWVTLVDGRKYRAEVVGADPMTDVAVLKINATHLHPATFADSHSVKAGHIVLAIGSPFRLTHSVSHGIVSAVGRTDVQVDIDYQNWIQTDAPINPGNSGGPLINARGEVIGISVAIATDSGGHQGVGFAIPSNTVAHVAGLLKNGEPIVRGYLGVVIQAVDPRWADAYGLEQPTGVFISGVGQDSPAAQSGLQPEDIILAIAGRPVASREMLQEIVADTKPGTVIEMTIWRDGARRTLRVTIGSQPEGFSTTGTIRDLNFRGGKEDQEKQSRKEGPEERHREEEKGGPPEPVTRPDEHGGATEFKDLGFRVQALTPALAQRLKLGERLDHGVVITNVDLTKEAYIAGLAQGQVILEANGKPLKGPADLEVALTGEALAKGVRLKIRVGEDVLYTVLQVR